VLTSEHASPVWDQPRLERTSGEAIVGAVSGNGTTHLARLRQQGAAKALLPANHEDAALDVVLLNTAGGLTGGDALRYEIDVGANAWVRVTSQAAERIYRALDGAAKIDITLSVADGARLEWLPQETILFDRGALSRTLTVQLDDSAEFTALEIIILGRGASGETVHQGRLTDQWRVSRGGRLQFADTLRIVGMIEEILRDPATGGDAKAMAMIYLSANDAETRLDRVRTACAAETGVEAAVSAFRSQLIVRLLSRDPQALRAAAARISAVVTGRRLPRIWQA
jgi:urease accessory protein